MDQNAIDATLQLIRDALERGEIPDAIAALTRLPPPDQADAFENLDDDDQAAILPELEASVAADLFEELEESEAASVAETLPADRLADVLDEMEPDEAADLLKDISADQASEALAQMEESEEVVPLLRHEDGTAGGLMTAPLAFRKEATAAQVIAALRSMELDEEVPYYLYVVDQENHLVGVVGLRNLVIAKPDATIGSIMNDDVFFATTDMDQEEAARMMARYDLASLPVVDEQGTLQGVITHDDMIDVLEDEATEDVLHLGGIESGPIGDKPYWSQNVREVVRSRFVWLLILFVGQTLTGTVLRAFQEQLQAVIELSLFIPLLIGTGGNAGSQTVTNVIRALALDEVQRRDALRVVFREARTGALLGLLLGAVAFLRVLLWGVSAELAVVVSVTVFAVCVWANTVGSLIPVLADAVGIDPTVMSAPLISTLVDATGLLIYLSVAMLILQQI